MTTPTLIIGLGGTGRQTLMQIRRLYLEDDPYITPRDRERRAAYRASYPTGRVPHTELLSIDTDDRLLDLDGNRFDPVLEAAALSGAEVLDIKIDAAKAANLYREPHTHPHYRDWYDFSLESVGIPEHGCGQTRPWGRLAFFHNQVEISKRIKAAIERLLSPEARSGAEKLGIGLENNNLKVQLVFSVAGGTGSGMFLDTAFLVRRLMQDFQGVTLTLEALVLLPTAFSNDPRHRVFANSYAALMEIEYYSIKRDQSTSDGWFPVHWEGVYSGSGEPPRLVGPVFNAVWLVGNVSRGVSSTRSGTRLGAEGGDKRALTGMIAEWLYLRSSPVGQSFGNVINSYLIGNAMQLELNATARIDVYEGEARESVDGGLEFSRRYASLGLAKIHAPSSLVQEQLAYRLTRDIIGDWLQETNLEAPVIESELRNARMALNLTSDLPPLDADERPMDERIFALSRSIDNANAGTSLLDVVVETLETEREQVTGPERQDDFEQTFSQWRQRYRGQKISDDDLALERKGDFARTCRDYGRLRENRDAAQLEALVTGYLGVQARGVTCARQVLTGLKNDYDFIAKEASTHVEAEAEAARGFDSDATDRLQFHEGSAYVKGVVARVCFNKQKDAFLSEIGRQIYVRTAELATAMAKLVGDKLRELGELELQLRRLRDELGRTEIQLAQRPHSKLNQLITASAGEGYHTELGVSLEEPATRWGLLLETPAPLGPWPIRQQLEGAGRAKFIAAFIDFAKARLDHVLRERTDALAAFDRTRTDDNDYRSSLRPVVDNATIWLDVQRDASAGWEANTPIQTHRLVMCGGDPDERARLRRELLQLGLDGAGEPINGPQDQVIIEEHVTGFPLFQVPSLRTYRDQAYEPMMAGIVEGAGEFTNTALHLEGDIDKYADLIKPDARQAQRSAEAMDLFLRAVACGVLDGTRNDKTGGVEFSFKSDVGLRQQVTKLGPHTKVLRILARENAPEAQTIQAQVQEREAKIRDGGSTSRAELMALIDYYANEESDHPLRSNRLFKRKANELAQKLAKDGGEEAKRMATSLVPGLKTWSKEAPEGSGFRRLDF
ncbi:hypothetical protein QO010_003523 [Caulobacter ginsengisoli]|uniref:Tubulin like n=1 Tax=Caulobacter ginsengisoli TaxID=400775 RepID=A0ABU0IUN3_9CAUL|nr:tubulin-like doman-containing protein [Caulobacter ginsengisoli]MDQ0465731.1 hypothetical protein [Caulobacter ginsengisoli]